MGIRRSQQREKGCRPLEGQAPDCLPAVLGTCGMCSYSGLLSEQVTVWAAPAYGEAAHVNSACTWAACWALTGLCSQPCPLTDAQVGPHREGRPPAHTGQEGRRGHHSHTPSWVFSPPPVQLVLSGTN